MLEVESGDGGGDGAGGGLSSAVLPTAWYDKESCCLVVKCLDIWMVDTLVINGLDAGHIVRDWEPQKDETNLIRKTIIQQFSLSNYRLESLLISRILISSRFRIVL